ncbi:MAG: GLUG motif-containing protein [Prevotella sp.]
MKKSITQFKTLLFAFFLTAVMLIPSVAWSTTITPSKPAVGDGSPNNPYEIGTAAELYWFAALVNGDTSVEGIKSSVLDACAKLTADIVVNKNLYDSLNEDGSVKDGCTVYVWTVICNLSTKFYTGIFEGYNHTISGLYSNEGKDQLGLFYSNSGTINNVGVINSYFSGNNKVGAVCGFNKFGIINNCYNTGIIIGNYCCGGVCGHNYDATIKNCYNTGNIICAYENAGGVCGKSTSTPTDAGEHALISTVENCYNTGSVNGNKYVGGVVGDNESSAKTGNPSSVVKNCYNTGAVSGDYSVGGVCGSNDSFHNDISLGNSEAIMGTAYMANCYSTGTVKGNDRVGGVCGYNLDYSTLSVIKNCYFDSNNYKGDAIGFIDSKEESHANGMTTEQFENGEVTYLLVQGCKIWGKTFEGTIWGQQLGTDKYPVLDSTYKILKAVKDGENTELYWRTFSDQTADAILSTSENKKLVVYNVTISDGEMKLTKRSDCQVALNEGVLLKTNAEYLNVMLSPNTSMTPVKSSDNYLIATPNEAKTISASDGNLLYRMSYKDGENKTGIGFFIGGADDSKDGLQLNVVPGEAYLCVKSSDATLPSASSPETEFLFPDKDDLTGIESITVTNEPDLDCNSNDIFDLMGRKVSKSTKGIFIKNGKKVIIK